MDDMQFACCESEVESIHLLDKNDYKVKLEKQQNQWILNDSFEVRQSAIDKLLQTMENQEISYWVPEAAKMNVVKDLSTNGIKVIVNTKNQRQPFIFYVGGVTPDETGTFMIKEDSEIPFVVSLPGFVGSLRSRYLLSEREWRSREILKLEASKISLVQLQYLADPAKSFELHRNNKKFTLTSANETLESNHAKSEFWLKRLSEINAESVIDDRSIIKDYLNRSVFVEIDIESSPINAYNLKVFPNTDDLRNTIDEKGQLEFNRYLIIKNNKEAFMVQRNLVDDLFIDYESLL